MSRLNDLMNALNPATDEDGYAVLQLEYDRIKEELAALRGYAKATYKNNAALAYDYGLFDSNYEPTYILTGEKELGVSYVKTKIEANK